VDPKSVILLCLGFDGWVFFQPFLEIHQRIPKCHFAVGNSVDALDLLPLNFLKIGQAQFGSGNFVCLQAPANELALNFQSGKINL
jgi:hypothetical protein